MNVRRPRVQVLAAAAVGVIALSGTAGTAAARSTNARIGPNQLFMGLVNGSPGIRQHAQIRVACPGPVRDGELTHPLAHQPLVVIPPPSTAGNVGHTGASATHITAFLGIPPSSNSEGIATFTQYGRRKPIPTSLDVPCSGSGFITFMPLPRDPGTSKSFVVPIDYVNIAT